MVFLRVVFGIFGVFVVISTLISAIKTFIVPRGINVWLTAVTFRSLLFLFRLRVRNATYEKRDEVMALFAPFTLFILPLVFLVMVNIGYMFIYWAIEPQPIYDIFKLSGSSLLTLGYASIERPIFKVLEFSEAMFGLILVALLIAYLPTMYAAFSKRESNIALLDGWASSPPSAVEFIARTHRNGEIENLRDFWMDWQRWFADLEESHTSLSPLSFFRSPMPDRSWVTASGVVMDSAALILSTIDIKWEPQAAFCIRSGFLALRSIADLFELPHNPNPKPGDLISISRAEFEDVCNMLVAQNVPIKSDREQAWQDFAGWRVNYDTVLLSLAALTLAPYAQWVSDRSVVHQIVKN